MPSLASNFTGPVTRARCKETSLLFSSRAESQSRVRRDERPARSELLISLTMRKSNHKRSRWYQISTTNLPTSIGHSQQTAHGAATCLDQTRAELLCSHFLPPFPTANAQNAMSEPPSTSSSSSSSRRLLDLQPQRQPLILSPPPVPLPREYRKGNWTLQETLVLIAAKKMDDERRAASSAQPSKASSCKTAELRWKWVENYCWSRGCHRSQNQCNDKWDNLLRDYKKVRDYESRPPQHHPNDRPSYWQMEKHHRKERNLPSNLSLDVFHALHDVVTHRHSNKTIATTPPSLPPPPPPPPPPASAEEAATDSSETEGGGRERQEEEEQDAAKKRRKVRSLGSSVLRGASVLARAILACDEKREKRHRDVVELEERKLQMEENRTEINRQGIAGFIAAVNNLSNAIQALASERRETTR